MNGWAGSERKGEAYLFWKIISGFVYGVSTLTPHDSGHTKRVLMDQIGHFQFSTVFATIGLTR